MNAFAQTAHAGGFKLAARRLVLATSVPPVVNLWKGLYAALTAKAVRLFKQYPGVHSVYLRRGCAKGELIPGISDIDFALIGSCTDVELADLNQRYERLARRTALLDQSLEIYTPDALQRLHAQSPYFQYRFTEGQATWRLIYGRDYLRELPPCTTDQLAAGLFYEIKVWWALFAGRLLLSNRLADDVVTRNSLCYKAVGETLKMESALDGGPLTFSRAQAMQDACVRLPEHQRTLVSDLQQIAAARFLTDDPALVDRTTQFLLTRLDQFYGRFAHHPLMRTPGSITQRVEFNPDMHFSPGAEQDHIHNLIRHAQIWSGFQAARTAASTFFNLDDMLLFLQVDAARLPTFEQLKSLIAMHWPVQERLTRRVQVFLQLQNACFQLDPDSLQKSWQSILTPEANPDVFEVLHHADASGAIDRQSSGPWNELPRHFFIQEKALFYELLRDPSIYKLNLLDFLRTFWKTAQLVVMNRGMARGIALYPLTIPAILSHLASENIPLPETLHPLIDAYQAELSGHSTDAAALIPRALHFLKEIER